ncbi:MAG TPA: hypothetical protein VK054_01655, partial [Beutenbergiaceae bacterium]|nr:hypothetical protein [Beutenbergiaceae bacterium]
DSESDSVVQTFAFEGGIIQLRYDLDGNREHRVFVDDAWTPWVTQSVLPGDGLEVDGSGTVSVDNTVVRTTRSITAGAGLTGGGTLAADRELSIAEGGVTPTLTQRLQARAVTANTTLELGDVDSVVEVNSGSARTVTVPTNASVPLPIGAVIEIIRWGAGAVTINPASGVALHSPDDARDIATQYGSAFLRKRATNEWHLSGDLE